MDSLFKDVTDEMRNIFKQNYDADDEESLEIILEKLKNDGYSQMQSLKLIMIELNLSITDADKLVLNSKAWQVEKKNNIKFRNDLGDALK